MITDEEFYLLSDIATTPFNDDYRLIYADWLEERCSERAEFVRAEVCFERACGLGVREPGALTRLTRELVNCSERVRDSAWERRITIRRAAEFMLALHRKPAAKRKGR